MSVAGRFCCKSRFALGVKRSAGRRRGFRVKMRGPHRRMSNSQAISVRRLRLTESAVASRVLFLRKIGRPATSDFCNKIGHLETFRPLLKHDRFALVVSSGRRNTLSQMQGMEWTAKAATRKRTLRRHAGRSESCRFCCKRCFVWSLKNSPGCRRGFRVKMRGASWLHAKLTYDFGKATQAIRISGCYSLRVFAKNSLPCNFRLLQQNLPKADMRGYDPSVPSKVLACFRSSVSKPSVNQL